MGSGEGIPVSLDERVARPSLLVVMTPAAPDGAPPRRIGRLKEITLNKTGPAPPCLEEALMRGALALVNYF
jgi:hypothetical protein